MKKNRFRLIFLSLVLALLLFPLFAVQHAYGIEGESTKVPAACDGRCLQDCYDDQTACNKNTSDLGKCLRKFERCKKGCGC